ncbi:MAG: ArsR/SmtB family transcription factor [Candidatus Helarchaeales archaeon]
MPETIKQEITIPLEQVLSTGSRVKILSILSERGELNISEIAKKCRINHNSCLDHLEALKKARVVEEKRFGRIRIYRIRTENMKIMALKKLFDLWNQY